MRFFLVVCSTVFPSAFGCGQIPQGQVEAVRFRVRGSTLPAAMVYSEAPNVHALVPLISRNEQGAKTLVKNLVMVAVEDVLQQQGRSAFLSDAVISLILQQLTTEINYTPLQCKSASIDPTMPPNPFVQESCFIINGMVTSLCMNAACTQMPVSMVGPVPSDFMMFTGTLRTSNIVMANWSRQMWQSVLDRVRQRLASASDPFGTFFSTAIVTIN